MNLGDRSSQGGAVSASVFRGQSGVVDMSVKVLGKARQAVGM